MTRVQIDLNIRVRGNATYAGFEDVTGPVAVDDVVEVYEPESGVSGRGRVTEIDPDRQLVYLSVEWASLTDEAAPADPEGPSSDWQTLVAPGVVTATYTVGESGSWIGFGGSTPKQGATVWYWPQSATAEWQVRPAASTLVEAA